MSLYFFSKLEEGNAATCVGAHRTLPLAAYALGNKALIVGEEGDVIATVQRAASNVSALAWHPHQPVLAIGWHDGNTSVWNQAGPEPNHSGAPQHESSGVVALSWTDGNVLGSVSKTGAAVLWMYEAPKLGVIHNSRCKTAASVRSLIPLHGTDDKPAEEPCFLATAGGCDAFMIDDAPAAHTCFQIDQDSTIVSLLWSPTSRNVVVLSSTSTVYQYHLAPDNAAHLQSKNKLSVGPNADVGSSSMIWAYPGIAAISSGDDVVRMLNVADEAMYTVSLPESSNDGANAQVQRINALASCRRKHLFAAGTRLGRIVVWNFNGTSKSDDESDWQIATSMDAPHRYAVDRLHFTARGAMIMSQGAITSMLQETTRLRAYGHNAMAVQTAPDTAVIIANSSGTSFTLRNGTRIKALDVAMPQVVVHTGRHLEIYSLTESTGSVTQLHSVELASSVVAVHPDGVLTYKDGKVTLQTLQLHPLQSVGFNDSEGVPTHIDVMGDFCCIVTSANKLKVCRISPRDLKVIGPARQLQPAENPSSGDEGVNFVVSSARVNARGKKVAFLRKPAAGGRPDTRVHVLDLDTDVVSSYDLAAIGQTPIDVSWNRPSSLGTPGGPAETESLLLTVETAPLKSAGAGPEEENAADASLLNAAAETAADEVGSNARQACSFFASPQGIMLHHHEPLAKDVVCLAGCTVPNLVLCSASGPNPNDHKQVLKRLRDFDGITSDDAKLREALVQFAYCSTIGNMDEAYKNVKTIKDPSVWTNLARMCVSSGRMDVAEVCLANMKDAVAARALREARQEAEPEVAQATLAMSLGMLDEAEKLFRQSKRSDLLTELYAACGKWDVATKHAETHDRIRIFPTLYRHAQHLESSGEFEEALQLYQKARCYGNEGPRILFMANRLDELRATVTRSDDKELIKWWAQFLESTRDIDGAIQQYARIKDGFNQVRLLCEKQPSDIDRAIELVADPEMPSARGAAYFIARHFEVEQNVQQAMQFYDTAGAFKNALRLAKENDMPAEIVSISLKCGDKHVALESGAFFEERGMYDKAAQLYQKGGDSQRAIDVCIKGGLYDELHRISESLDAAADPETFIAMAEHFIVSGHHAKAVQMLVFGKAFNEALQLCIDNEVPLTEEMAEAMTLPKSSSQEDEEYRVSLLKKIAKVAKAQESWYLACKKYTQAGERVKAVKCLLRSGDTEKVIFFANHSRNAEIYVLAANYLQSQNWQTDTAIYKNIVTFYTKAKAFEQLAGFFDACAQLQVDEYRDYDKALTTLREAQKALDKGDADQLRKDNMRRRAEFVEQFINARSLIKPGEECPQMVEMCNDLLTRADPTHMDAQLLEQAVRVGDIFALLVEYNDKLGKSEGAFQLMERMQQQGIQLTYFLEPTLVEKICKATGHDPSIFADQQQHHQAPAHGGGGGGGGDGDDDIAEDDFVEEEVM